MIEFITLFSTLYIFYTVIPFCISRILGKGVVKKNTEKKVSLTFDDGPDPIYTNLLLKLLKNHNIKATFFVQGDRAIQYPEIIRKIQNEGHLLAIHGFDHRSNWLMSPWTVKKKLKEASLAIESITEIKPLYYRPPWGLLNIFDFLLTKRTYTIVFWSVMVKDWRIQGGCERIKRDLIKKVQPGSIICLHDCGETTGAEKKAPVNMIKALESFLDETNFQYKRLDEVS